MFLSLFSCIVVLSTLWPSYNGLVIKNIPENKPENHLKNTVGGELLVDLDIHDEDYNWVEYDLLNNQLLDQFKEFDKVLIEEYDKTKGENVKDKRPKAKITSTEIDNGDSVEVVATLPSIHSIEKREVTIGTGDGKNSQHYKEAKQKYDSEYNKSLYGLKTGFRVIKEAFSFDTNCTCIAADACGIGIRSIKCLFDDFKARKEAFSVLAARIWRVALIWLFLYSSMAIPFWCTKGWCCCCLRCKFFKPQETIQEAKDYLLLNPPGVLVTKKGAIIHYEPTEREKDCYEEFGHFMRTL